MAIVAGDIKVYESEKLSEDADAGGLITATEIVCGAANNMFPNISRIDRLRGRTQLRKVFPKIIEVDQTAPNFGLTMYSGSHLIVKEIPTDDNVSITLFDNGTKDNLLDSGTLPMMDFFESYYVTGSSLGSATTAFVTTAGAYQLSFKVGEWDRTRTTHVSGNGFIGFSYWYEWTGTSTQYTLNVNGGDVCVIDGEYIQVQKVETIRQVITKTDIKSTGIEYKILTLVSPLNAGKAAALPLSGTLVNGAWKCYGTATLSGAASSGELELIVDSEKVRIMPTIDLPSEISGYFPFPEPTIVDGVTVGAAPNTWTLDGIEQPTITGNELGTAATVYVLVFLGGVLESSISIKVRYQNKWETVTDDGVGGLQGFGTGSIDYVSGIANVNFVGAPDTDTHIIYSYKLAIGYKEYDTITQVAPSPFPAFPGSPIPLDFGKINLKEGSAYLQYDDAASRTLTIYDDGTGILKFKKDFILEDSTFKESATEVPWQQTTGVLGPYGEMAFHDTKFFQANPVSNDLWSCVDGLSWVVDTSFAAVGELTIAYGGQSYCEVNDIQFVWGDEASGVSYQVLGYRSGISGAFSFSTLSTIQGINAAACGDGWFVCSADDGSEGIYVMDTTVIGTATRVVNVAIGTAVVTGFGTDGNGTSRFIVINGTTINYCDGPNFDVPGNWNTDSLPITGPITCITFDPRFEIWAVSSDDADVVFSTDGGATWVSRRAAILNDIPQMGGGDGDNIAHITTDGNGSFVFTNGENAGESTIGYTSDAGATWSFKDVTGLGALASENLYGIAINPGGPSIDGIVCVMGYRYTGNQVRSFTYTFDSYSDLPDDAGTINVAAGTGSLSAVTAPVPFTDIEAVYFLQHLDEPMQEYSFILETDPPIEANSLICNINRLSDFTQMTVQETGGVLTGDVILVDGPWTSQINHAHGYALIKFDEVAVHETLEIGVRGLSVFHPAYDEYDTDRIPTSGLVPGFAVGDTVVIAKRVIPITMTGGTFLVDDVITGANGQKWTISEVNSVILITVKDKVGVVNLIDTEVITGAPSGATATVNNADGVDYVEEMAIVTGVTKSLITIAVSGGLLNDYPEGTLISNAIVPGDLQASTGTYFSENAWVSWSDAMQSTPADGTWDTAGFPPVVTNNGAITERWRITVDSTTPTLVTVDGEATGIVLGPGFNMHGGPMSPAGLLAQPYFTIPVAGWSADTTHQVNNVYRFNTTGTEYPLWVCRTINAQSSLETVDAFLLEVRGDVA